MCLFESGRGDFSRAWRTEMGVYAQAGCPLLPSVRSPSGEPGRRSSSSRLHPHLLTQAGVHSLNDFRGLLFAGPSHTPAPVTICTPRPHTPPPVHEPVSSQGVCLREQTSQRDHSAPYPVHMPQHTHLHSHTCAHTHLHTPHLGTNGTHLVWRDTCDLAHVPGACGDGLPRGGCDWAQMQSHTR